MTLTCGELLIKLLEAEGVDTVFGIPGVHTIELYRGLAASPIRHVTPRHEQGAGFMADGFARATGKVGVCLCITGPGMTNIATAMGQAYADSIPMLVISGVNQRDTLGMGRGQLHEMKHQRETLAGVTGFSHTLLCAEDLPEVLARAFSCLRSGRPRPVHLEVPIDVMSAPAGDTTGMPPIPPRPGPDRTAMQAIAARLVAAERPLILAGGGAAEAGTELARLCEQLDAPVCLTVNARGILPPDHPLLLDGVQSSDPFRNYVKTCDAVLAVGTELGETDYDYFAKGPLEVPGDLLRIDIDPGQMRINARPALSLVSDAAKALTALNEELGQLPGRGRAGHGAEDTARINAEVMQGYAPETRQYRDLMAQLKEACPEAIIVGDSTKPVYHANLVHRAAAPRRWFNAVTGFGTLGYALPAALGAKIACPERAVIAIAGDGGFQFTLNELMTATQEEIPVAVILWNNACFREIRDYMQGAEISPVGVDVAPPDFEALSRAMGCGYAHAKEIAAIGPALKGLEGRRTPLIIEYRPQNDA